MKLVLQVHSSDNWFSYAWYDGNHNLAGQLSYNLSDGVFSYQKFPESFTFPAKVRAYMSLLHDVLRIIKLKKRYYEKES